MHATVDGRRRAPVRARESNAFSRQSAYIGCMPHRRRVHGSSRGTKDHVTTRLPEELNVRLVP
jgi:hypothetical protein